VLAEVEQLKKRLDALEQRFGSLEERFSTSEERFASLEKRFDAFEENVNHRFEEQEAHQKAFEERVEAQFREARDIWESVLDKMDRLSTKFDLVISDFQDVRVNVKRLDKRVTSLEAGRTQ
jgi:hypothetical protein